MTKCLKASCFFCLDGQKRKFFHFFKQKKGKIVCFIKKSCTFASHLSIGLWCNGNTADSGPAFPGSSPGSPTRKTDFQLKVCFSCFFIQVLFNLLLYIGLTAVCALALFYNGFFFARKPLPNPSRYLI